MAALAIALGVVVAAGTILKPKPSLPENEAAIKIPPPSRSHRPSASDPAVFADGSVVITLGEGADGEDIRLNFQEIFTETAPDLPAGYSHPLRMFRITALGLGARHDLAPYPATINVLLTEQDLVVAGGDPYRLVVRRYDETASAWKSTPSSVDLPWLRVETTTDALGLFATMAVFADEGQDDRRGEYGAGRKEKAGYELAGIRPLMAETVVPSSDTPAPVSLPTETPRPQPVAVSPPVPTPTLTPTPTPTPTPKPTPTPTLTPTPSPSPTIERDDTENLAATAALIPTLDPSPKSAATQTPTPTATSTSTPTSTPSPTSSPTPTHTPGPSYRLFINGRQVLSSDVRFHVPLGIVTISALPGPGDRYTVGSEVSLYVDVDPLGSDLRITGADEANGSSGRLRIDGDRFVIVYISPKPTPTCQRPSPVSQLTGGSRPMPTLTLTPTLTPTPTPTPTSTPKPAGGLIAFQTDRDGNSEIYAMYRDGSEPVNLTGHTAADKHPSLSGGGLLAFASDRIAPEGSQSGFDVYLLTLHNREAVRLTTHESDDHNPAITASGDKVAFVSRRDDDNSEIYVLSLSEKNQPKAPPVNITDNAADDTDPAWSPDGCRLVFASNRDGDWDIYLSDGDRSKPLNLTDSGEDDIGGFDERWPGLAFHEGRERLIFASDRTGNWDVYSMYTDGSDLGSVDISLLRVIPGK